MAETNSSPNTNTRTGGTVLFERQRVVFRDDADRDGVGHVVTQAGHGLTLIHVRTAAAALCYAMGCSVQRSVPRISAWLEHTEPSFFLFLLLFSPIVPVVCSPSIFEGTLKSFSQELDMTTATVTIKSCSASNVCGAIAVNVDANTNQILVNATVSTSSN